MPWSQMAVLVRSGRTSIPGCAAAWAPPASRSRWPATTPRWSASAVLPLLEALRVVVNLDNDDPEHVDHVDATRS